MRQTKRTLAMILAVSAASPSVWAQASMSPRVLGGGGGVVVVPNDPMLDPESPEARAYADLMGRKRAFERELRLIQRSHFGTMRNVERREIGLRKLRGYTDPAALIAMTELFDRERSDVRGAVLDHIAEQETDEAETLLAWESVRGRDAWYRARAREHMAGRAERRREAGGELSPRVRGVIASALGGSNDTAAVEAGRLAGALRLFEFVPMMAMAQSTARRSVQERTGDLGWIMIGRQTTFISDYTPVVSNSAVGLDPQVSVVSDGVMLRVHEAVVMVYRTEIFETLVEMTSEAWGRPTRSMGYDSGAWREWYEQEFVPFLASGATGD